MQSGLTLCFCCALAMVGSACTDDPSPSEGERPRDMDAGRDANVSTDASRDHALDALVRRFDAQTSDARASDARTNDAEALLASRLSELMMSRATWRALRDASPGPYWYTEENCLVNSATGHVTTIQVEQTTPRVFEKRSIAWTACQAGVNRSDDIASNADALTLEQLYLVCEAQLKNMPASNFALDTRGVLKACWFPSEDNCEDNCGSGFYIRDWQFGQALPTADGGVRADAGS